MSLNSPEFRSAMQRRDSRPTDRSEMSLFNGSDATVHDVVLHLRVIGKNGALLADLDYSFVNRQGTPPLTSSQQIFALTVVKESDVKQIEVTKVVRATAFY